MKARFITVALAGALGSGGVFAEENMNDGNKLLEYCQSYIKLIDSERDFVPIEAGACGGFVEGVVSTVSFYREVLKKDEMFCVPDSASKGQLVRIVVKYLKDNPKDLNKGRTTLVWSALIDAYPCK